MRFAQQVAMMTTQTRYVTVEAAELADVLRRVARLENRLADLERRHAELDEVTTGNGTTGDGDVPSLATVSKWIDQICDCLGLDLSLLEVE